MGQLGQFLLVMRRVPLPEIEYSINLQHNATKPFAIVDYFMYNGEPIVSAHLETLNETGQGPLISVPIIIKYKIFHIQF